MESKKYIPDSLLSISLDEKFSKSINMNKLQKIKIETIINIIEDVIVSNYKFNKKSDAINTIVRHIIKCGYYIVGSGMLERFNGDNYGFIRHQENNYVAANDDVFLSSKLIRNFSLNSGDEIEYVVKTMSENDKRMQVTDVLSINGVETKGQNKFNREKFDNLSPEYPDKKFNLGDFRNKDNSFDSTTSRIVDLFAPIGYGQRGIIVAPPKSGKTIIFQSLAEAISLQHSEVKIIILLVDERPEEVTEMQKKLGHKCKIMFSDFNETSSHHIHVSLLCIEHAKRLVESGKDVIIFLDSLTRLARAFNASLQNTGKTLTGGVDPNALQQAKKLFGAARNIQNGGSLTIIATCLVETGSKMDDIIFEEFKGTGNMEIVLSKYLAERSVYPAIDVLKSGTRRSELLISQVNLAKIASIRKFLTRSRYPDGVENVIAKIRETKSNTEFLGIINYQF